MPEKILPRYPVYVISKGRFENCLTAKFLLEDEVPFHIVVEPHEANEYISRFGNERVLVLPFSNLGLGSIPARNWVWERSKEIGAERHWILDDNIRGIYRRFQATRIPCTSGVALRVVEDFTDRYENIAIAGLNYSMFCIDKISMPPFFQNVHVYSCLCIMNALPNRWRGRYNEDTDLCLQVLAEGWCTILVNAFNIKKMATLKMKGGNMDQLYQGDGRLKMARALERLWPHVVKVGRRFKRPQHIVHDNWKKFDTPLKLKPGIDLANIEQNDYGLTLNAVKPVKSPRLRELLTKQEQE